MKRKRIFALFLCVILCISILPTSALASGRNTSFEETLASDLKTLGLFKGISDTDFDLNRAPTRVEALIMLIRVLGKEGDALNNTWRHPFTDVPAWADSYVGYAYQSGLTNGISATEFGTGNADAAMYLTFVLRSLGYSDANGADFTWNAPFTLAKNVGLLPNQVNTTAFWRADVVSVSYAALAIKLKDSDQTLAQKLISMGVFTQAQFDSCYDADAFSSHSAVQIPSGERLTAEQIAEKCADAVFYIDIYGFNGELTGSGSGFFISDTGLAITNFHVACNSSALHITTVDGTLYSDVKIIDGNSTYDIALLKVNGGPFPYLTMGDSTALKQGQTIYTIGSPIGLQNTMSQGLVSNPKRILDGTEYIQISAQIAPGSSGGALLNEYGQVVGVTSAGFIDVGADLNLAIPIERAQKLDMTSTTDYYLWANTPYTGFELAYDFGVFSGVDLIEYYYTPLGYHFVYDLFDFHDIDDLSASDRFAFTYFAYRDALVANGFTLVEETDNSYICVTDNEFLYLAVDWDGFTIDIWAEDRLVTYGAFPNLPDLGWYIGIDPLYAESAVGRSLMYCYLWNTYYTADEFANLMEWYYFLLEDYGFTRVFSDDTTALFEGHDLSIVYMIDQTSVVVDVAPLS